MNCEICRKRHRNFQYGKGSGTQICIMAAYTLREKSFSGSGEDHMFIIHRGIQPGRVSIYVDLTIPHCCCSSRHLY